MKKSLLSLAAIAILTLVCSCQGRRTETVVADGDTVEVNIAPEADITDSISADADSLTVTAIEEP